MNFLSPLALALLALILPIIALYLLKLRRQEHQVSSIYLWQRFVRDVEANAPWQRLRRNLLLLLQILFMLALILALARPATRAEGVAGQTVVLILDSSASMAARDGNSRAGIGGPDTRLEAAREAARNLVLNLPDDARVTVLAAAGGEVETLVSASRDRGRILEALAAVQPAALDSNLRPALTLAQAIVAREASAEIVLLSDGAVELPAAAGPIRLVPVGRSSQNQAISALSLTPAEKASDEPVLFVQATNYGRQVARRRLVVQADGASFSAFDLTLPPGQPVGRFVDSLPPGAQTITAFLEPAEEDVLPLDDRAWTAIQPTGPVQVILVTQGNTFLQTALSVLNAQDAAANVDLTVVSPEAWRSPSENNTGQEAPANPPIYIFDAYVPDTLPAGNLLFIGPPAAAPDLFDLLGQVDNPAPGPAARDEHPLLQDVSLADTQILKAMALVPGAWGRTLLTGLPGSPGPGGEPIPLLLAGEKEGRRIVVLAFDLHQSDLPLRPAFPILAANLVDYLAPGLDRLAPARLAPGEAFSIALPPRVERLRLAPPAGPEISLTPVDGRATLPPAEQPGLYSLTFEPAGQPVYFAVNLFDPVESDITPRPNLAVAGAGRAAAAGELPPAYQEWWRPLALVALGLLAAEWLVYQRSRIAQFSAWLRRRRLNH